MTSRKDDETRHQIDAVPAPRLMQTIGATALSPTAAVAELVANSFDARLDDCPVTVQVRLHEGRIEVIDDSRGMSLAVLSNALRLGVDMDKVSATRSGRMGTYGLGLKTAAASLGDRWGIVTRPANVESRVEYHAEFDLRQWAGRASTADQWTMEIVESLPDLNGPLGEASHGTLVWIEQLRFKNHMPGAYLDHLARAFAPFLSNGHVILVGEQSAVVPTPRLVEGSRHEFDTLVDVARGWRIKGWVGLDTKTHNDDNFGIDLYCKDQLIEIHNKDFFSVHLMTSRILGEAHLDFVPVNFNKVDFSKGTEEWTFARAAMRELLKPVVEASRMMSRNRHDESRVTRAVTKLNQALGGGQDGPTSFPGAGEAEKTQGAPGVPSVANETVRLRASGRTLWLPRGPVQIDAQVDELDSEVTPWDYIFEHDTSQLLVVINPMSETFKKMKDVDFLACIAVSTCIARFLIEREKVDPAKARRVSNEWLHEAVTGTSLWTHEHSAGLDESAAS